MDTVDGTQLLIPTLYITLSPQPYIIPLRFVLLLSIYSYGIVLGVGTGQKIYQISNCPLVPTWTVLSKLIICYLIWCAFYRPI